MKLFGKTSLVDKLAGEAQSLEAYKRRLKKILVGLGLHETDINRAFFLAEYALFSTRKT